MKLKRITIDNLIRCLEANSISGFGNHEVMAIGTTSEGEFSFLLKNPKTDKEERFYIPYMSFVKEEEK